MNYHRRLAPGKYALQVADYELLADAGAFGDSRTELIEGEVIVMSPQLLPHGLVKADLYDRLRDAMHAIGSQLRVLSEVSLEIALASDPPNRFQRTCLVGGDCRPEYRYIRYIVIETSDPPAMTEGSAA